MASKSQKPEKASGDSAAARRRVVEAWRGVDLTPLELANSSSAHTASSVMPSVLKTIGLDRRRLEAEVGKVWNHLLDPTLAAHAQPAGLAKGTLFVNVDSNVWLHEIVRYRRKEILEQLQHSFGPEFIRKISFRVA